MCTVSVLVPVYNVAPYIRACVDSILNQTFSDFELILCDDGSTDESGRICDEYARKDSRVRVIHKLNEGNAPTRRALLSSCCGEYVLFADSDDWIALETLEHTVRFARQTGSDVVMFGTQVVSDSGELVERVPPLFSDKSVFRGEDRKRVYREFCSGSSLNHVWDKLIARRLWTIWNKYSNGLRRGFKGEDVLQLLPIFERAECFGWLSESMYFYRLSSNGMGRNFQLHYFPDARFVNEWMLCFIERMLGTDPAEKVPLYRYYLKGLSTRVMSCVHSGRFTSREMKEAFRQERESEIYRDALRIGGRVLGSILQRMTIWLFAHEMDTAMILMLRAEGRIKHGLLALGLRKR